MQGDKIIVTGASSGIGKALCELLVERGAEVIGLCRRSDGLAAGVDHIACDLSDEVQIRETFASIGKVDGLVNNAGVAKLSSIIEGDLEDWDTMWKVNVRALALCSQLVLPKLSATGNIVNVSSMSGHRVPPSGGFYSPTKFAVRAISEALRCELRAVGSTVRVSSVSPGFVDTPLLDDYFSGREAILEKTKKEIQMLQPQDIAHSIVHILSSPHHVEIGDVQLRSSDQKI